MNNNTSAIPPPSPANATIIAEEATGNPLHPLNGDIISNNSGEGIINSGGDGNSCSGEGIINSGGDGNSGGDIKVSGGEGIINSGGDVPFPAVTVAVAEGGEDTPESSGGDSISSKDPTIMTYAATPDITTLPTISTEAAAYICQRVAAEFDSGVFRGTVTSFDPVNEFFVTFDDDDSGDYSLADVKKMIRLYNVMGESPFAGKNQDAGKLEKSSPITTEGILSEVQGIVEYMFVNDIPKNLRYVFDRLADILPGVNLTPSRQKKIMAYCNQILDGKCLVY